MRIIAGRFKGLRLPSPKGKGVRPTADRVREAIFSSVGETIEDASVLDLFAGTGAFGLEALSRGARHVTFVEKDRRQCERLTALCEQIGESWALEIVSMDALQAIEQLERSDCVFDVAFLDPPYETDWIDRIVSDPRFRKILARGAICVVERTAQKPSPRLPNDAFTRSSRSYGGTLVDIVEFP